jgi:hypothetical protein
MRSSSESRGVCIVRVTRQSTGLLLTLTVRVDVENMSTQSETSTTDVDEALATVRRFVEDFAREHPARRNPTSLQRRHPKC